MDKIIYTKKIINLLKKEYPNAKCSLNFANALELLVATILSAQCTDVRVNIVTEKLFKKYKNCKDYINIFTEELEQDIRSTGFYKNKTKSIKGSCEKILNEFKGKVPDKMEQLITLPGVARKTANVVLGNFFNVAEGIVVDTHVHRLANRMDLSDKKYPEEIEKDLMQIVAKEDWILFGHLLINHGRKVCTARKAFCEKCCVGKICLKKMI